MAKETEEQIEARMEAARNKLSQDVQDKFNKDGDVDERDRRSEAAGRLRRTEPVSKTPAKKAPVVTKEQLEKSGLSLRDYMNKQKGLTRRDGKAPDAAKPATTTSKPTAKPSEPAAKPSAPAVSNSYRLEGAGRPKPAAKSSEPATSAGKSMFQRIAEKETMADRIRQRGEDDLKSRGMKAGGSVKMAKGSSINGIAKRGLTNCKQR